MKPTKQQQTEQEKQEIRNSWLSKLQQQSKPKVTTSEDGTNLSQQPISQQPTQDVQIPKEENGTRPQVEIISISSVDTLPSGNVDSKIGSLLQQKEKREKPQTSHGSNYSSPEIDEALQTSLQNAKRQLEGKLKFTPPNSNLDVKTHEVKEDIKPNTSVNDKPWEAFGLTEEEYKRQLKLINDNPEIIYEEGVRNPDEYYTDTLVPRGPKIVDIKDSIDMTNGKPWEEFGLSEAEYKRQQAQLLEAKNPKKHIVEQKQPTIIKDEAPWVEFGLTEEEYNQVLQQQLQQYGKQPEQKKDSQPSKPFLTYSFDSKRYQEQVVEDSGQEVKDGLVFQEETLVQGTNNQSNDVQMQTEGNVKEEQKPWDILQVSKEEYFIMTGSDEQTYERNLKRQEDRLKLNK